jgi:acyl-CoA reductase-like NAD-dependent aldehyde dehydrogenase
MAMRQFLRCDMIIMTEETFGPVGPVAPLYREGAARRGARAAETIWANNSTRKTRIQYGYSEIANTLGERS